MPRRPELTDTAKGFFAFPRVVGDGEEKRQVCVCVEEDDGEEVGWTI